MLRTGRRSGRCGLPAVGGRSGAGLEPRRRLQPVDARLPGGLDRSQERGGGPRAGGVRPPGRLQRSRCAASRTREDRHRRSREGHGAHQTSARRGLRAGQPEGDRVRAADRVALDSGGFHTRHAPRDRQVELSAQSARPDPVRPVQRRRLPGAPVAQAEGQGADRAAAEGPGGRAQALRPRRRERGGRPRRRRLSRRTIRRLRGRAKGRYRTRGRRSAATVRGTKWTVADRCDGTLTKVKRGKVAVRDFRKKKTIVLRRGKSYLAKARG